MTPNFCSRNLMQISCSDCKKWECGEKYLLTQIQLCKTKTYKNGHCDAKRKSALRTRTLRHSSPPIFRQHFSGSQLSKIKIEDQGGESKTTCLLLSPDRLFRVYQSTGQLFSVDNSHSFQRFQLDPSYFTLKMFLRVNLAIIRANNKAPA